MIKLALDSFPYAPDLVGRYNDFTTDEELNEFVGTAINSGTAAITDNNSAPNGSGGVLLLSGAATTDDSGYNLTGDTEWMRISAPSSGASRIYRYLTRFQLSDATESDLLAGMAITDTSLVASAPSDGIYFLKSDGSTTINAVVRAASATVATVQVATATTNWTTLTWELAVDTAGTGLLICKQDGVLQSSNRLTTLPTTEALTFALGFQSGTATGTIYSGIDLVGAWQSR